jgi:hypothetical protein
VASKSIDTYVNGMHREKKKSNPLMKIPVLRTWFLVPCSYLSEERNRLGNDSTKIPRSNPKIHNEKQRWWRKDTEARNRRSPNQDGNLFEPPIFRQNSVKRETDSETDRQTDTLRERRNNGCRQGM